MNDLADPLFVALTRPPMFFGVPINYFLCTSFITFALLMLSYQTVFLLIYPALHVLGFFVCYVDHGLFDVIFKKIGFVRSMNYSLWGCQSYEPF